MIKRLFYSVDHPNDNDGASDNSSSSSEDDPEPTNELSTNDKSEEEEEEVVAAAAAAEESPESGYQSENSSDSDEEFDATEAWPGHLTSDDNGEPELLQDSSEKTRSIDLIKGENINFSIAQEKHSNQWAEAVEETEKDRALHNLDCVIKCKSVFKCKLCPRIVCLSVDTMEVHLASKRHARSQKLFAEGRLKLMLNSDGEVEEDAETHAERHARIVAAAEIPQTTKNSKKRNRGRQRQKQRMKKKALETGSKKTQVKFSSEASTKKINAGKI